VKVVYLMPGPLLVLTHIGSEGTHTSVARVFISPEAKKSSCAVSVFYCVVWFLNSMADLTDLYRSGHTCPGDHVQDLNTGIQQSLPGTESDDRCSPSYYS